MISLKKTIALTIAMAVTSIATASENQSSENEIKKHLESKFGQEGSILYIKETETKGNYFAVLGDGTNISYTAGSENIVLGDIYNISERTNISESMKGGYNLEVLSEIDQDDKVLYPSDVEGADWVTVFTDPTCGYCRKVHQNIEEYNKLGISIAYTPFPRGSETSQPFIELEKIWCSDDKNKSMDLAKNDNANSIDYKITSECSSKVKKSLMIGEKLRIRGTPSIYTESGINIPGFIPPESLRKMIDDEKKNKN